MIPLTSRVEAQLDEDDNSIFGSIRQELPTGAHVEHVLSHLGDLIALAERTKEQAVTIGETKRKAEDLRQVHERILRLIRDTILWGYVPAEDGIPERIGQKHASIVSVDGHRDFVQALFHRRRAGLERRPPVAFFTTNYDTLLEDALALSRIVATDGFSGGAMAFWEPGSEFESPFTGDAMVQARIYKLHGSLDWVTSTEDIVVRRREGARYPDESSAKLLIYPQATKYKLTQRDPFASLFRAFRSALCIPQPGLLAICGYSFGDDHINEEIERALKQRENRLTVLAFVLQDSSRTAEADRGLPSVIQRWLGVESESWKERIIVAGSHGIYHGSLDNLCPCSPESPHSWWSFEGVTSLLAQGPEVL